MSHTIYTRKEIPDAPYYVLSNDTFMSGWGFAKGKINTVILPCKSYSQALRVESYAHTRSDTNRVRIVCNKPRLHNSTHLYSLYCENSASTWYGNSGED